MNQFEEFLKKDMKFTFPEKIRERIEGWLDSADGRKYLEEKGYGKCEKCPGKSCAPGCRDIIKGKLPDFLE